MTTSCSKPVSRMSRETEPKGDGGTPYLNSLEPLASTRSPEDGSAPGRLRGRRRRRGDRAGHLPEQRAGREVAREALPELLGLVLVPHLVLREARLVEHLIELAVVGIRGEERVQAALGGAPGPALDVEVAHGVLVLG